MKTYYYSLLTNCRGIEVDKSSSVQAENILDACIKEGILLQFNPFEVGFVKGEEEMEVFSEGTILIIGTSKFYVEKRVGECILEEA
jgi:hypothetical protein